MGMNKCVSVAGCCQPQYCQYNVACIAFLQAADSFPKYTTVYQKERPAAYG